MVTEEEDRMWEGGRVRNVKKELGTTKVGGGRMR